MANDRSIDFELLLKNKEFKKKLKESIKDIKSLSKETKKTSTSIKGLSTNFKLVSGVIASVGLLKFTKDIIEASKGTEKLVLKLSAIQGSTKKARESLAEFDRLTIKLGRSAAETENAFVRLVGAGIKPTEEVMTSISDIANTFGISMERSTRVLLRSASGNTQALKRLEEFGVGLSKVDKKTNTLTLSYNNQTITAKNTADGLKQLVLNMAKLEGIAGATASVMEGLSGKQAGAKRSVDALYGSIGDLLNPSLNNYYSNVIDITKSLNSFVSKNGATIRAIAKTTAIMTGLTTAFILGRRAVLLFGTAMRGLTLKSGAIGLAIAGIGFLIAKMIEFNELQEENARKKAEFSKDLIQSSYNDELKLLKQLNKEEKEQRKEIIKTNLERNKGDLSSIEKEIKELESKPKTAGKGMTQVQLEEIRNNGKLLEQKRKIRDGLKNENNLLSSQLKAHNQIGSVSKKVTTDITTGITKQISGWKQLLNLSKNLEKGFVYNIDITATKGVDLITQEFEGMKGVTLEVINNLDDINSKTVKLKIDGGNIDEVQSKLDKLAKSSGTQITGTSGSGTQSTNTGDTSSTSSNQKRTLGQRIGSTLGTFNTGFGGGFTPQTETRTDSDGNVITDENGNAKQFIDKSKQGTQLLGTAVKTGVDLSNIRTKQQLQNINQQKAMIDSFMSWRRQSAMSDFQNEMSELDEKIEAEREANRLIEEETQKHLDKLKEIRDEANRIHDEEAEAELSKKFQRIDAEFQKKLTTLEKENLTDEEFQTQKEILEAERKLQKDNAEEEVENKKKEKKANEDKKLKEETKKANKKANDEKKKNLNDIRELNKEKTKLQKDFNSKQQAEDKKMKIYEYVVGKQVFDIQKKSDLMNAKIDYLAGLSNIIAAYAPLGFAGIPAAAAHSAMLTATYSSSNALIKSQQYPPPMAFKEGGMFSGGTPGVDSINALVHSGEVLVPEKRFKDLESAWITKAKSDMGYAQTINITFMNENEEKIDDERIDMLENRITENEEFLQVLRDIRV